MKNFEKEYAALIAQVLTTGKISEGRNGRTVSDFGHQFTIDLRPADGSKHYAFPLLIGRKMYFKGILGEFVSFLQGATTVEEFEANGCNYWKQWADDDGNLELDYGTAWTNIYGHNQLAATIQSIKDDPHSRRHIISSWRPERVLSDELSLPCCHYTYQWYVRDNHLHMIWIQRSVDLMIGLPSDFALAAIFNIMMAQLTGYKPGIITMQLGDCHIYEEHALNAIQYVNRVKNMAINYSDYPKVNLIPITSYEEVDTDFIELTDYNPQSAIKFELKS